MVGLESYLCSLNLGIYVGTCASGCVCVCVGACTTVDVCRATMGLARLWVVFKAWLCDPHPKGLL